MFQEKGEPKRIRTEVPGIVPLLAIKERPLILWQLILWQCSQAWVKLLTLCHPEALGEGNNGGGGGL